MVFPAVCKVLAVNVATICWGVYPKKPNNVIVKKRASVQSKPTIVNKDGDDNDNNDDDDNDHNDDDDSDYHSHDDEDSMMERDWDITF